MSTQVNFKIILSDPEIPADMIENVMKVLQRDLRLTVENFFKVNGAPVPQISIPAPEIVTLLV